MLKLCKKAGNEASLMLNSTAEKVASCVKDLQPWDNYFTFRLMEMKALLSSFDFPKQALILEIGCANGFNSCLLSAKAEQIIPTDLFAHDIRTHSQGMEGVKRMFEAAEVTNYKLIACSGESLPFEDLLFDMIFILNTLEHIPDKEKALKEALRVLKKGGKLVVTVPNFFSFLFYPLLFYKNACLTMLRKMSSRPGKETGSTAGAAGSLAKRYPHFPFPEPHGAYATYLHEIINYMPWNWIGLFKKSGFKVESVFSTIIMPWHLLSFINSSLPIKIYEKTALREAGLGRRLPFKYLGSNLCIIANK